MSFTDRRADTSDVGRVWTEAIDQYCADTKTDPAEFRNMRNLDTIMKEQKRQVDRFESFRHTGSKGDKIRHFVNKNSDIVRPDEAREGCSNLPADRLCLLPNKLGQQRVRYFVHSLVHIFSQKLTFDSHFHQQRQ